MFWAGFKTLGLVFPLSIWHKSKAINIEEMLWSNEKWIENQNHAKLHWATSEADLINFVPTSKNSASNSDWKSQLKVYSITIYAEI